MSALNQRVGIPSPHFHTSDTAVRKRYMAHVEAIRQKRDEPKPVPKPEPRKVGRPSKPATEKLELIKREPKPPKVQGIKHEPKPVVSISRDGTITTYPSRNTAAKLTGIDAASILRALHGQRQSAGGLRWEYAKCGEND